MRPTPRPVSTSKCRIISAIRSENRKVKERLLCPSKGVLLIECSVVGIVEGIRLITKLRTSRPVLPLRPFVCESMYPPPCDNDTGEIPTHLIAKNK